MSFRPGVSACTVLFESRRLLEPLVASLRNQSVPLAAWVFCINGPDDGAAAWLAELPEKPIVLRRPDNPGFSAGANACIVATSTSHVLLLNPDVVLEPDYVAHCLTAFGPRVAAVGGRLLRRAGDRVVMDSAGFAMQPWFRLVDRGAEASAEGAYMRREEVPGLCGAAVVLARDALDRLAPDHEYFDADYFMYKEDQDLGLRLRAAGGRLIYEPTATAWHARGFRYGARRDVAPRLRRHSLKNRYLLILTHWRLRRDAWRLPFVIVFEIALFLRLLILEPSTLLAWLDVWHHMGRTLAKRRRLIKVESSRCADSRIARAES